MPDMEVHIQLNIHVNLDLCIFTHEYAGHYTYTVCIPLIVGVPPGAENRGLLADDRPYELR